jgi:hypothetical protein
VGQVREPFGTALFRGILGTEKEQAVLKTNPLWWRSAAEGADTINKYVDTIL